MEGILRSEPTDVGSEQRMVGNAGNAPVRRFRFCFVTPDLQCFFLPSLGWTNALRRREVAVVRSHPRLEMGARKNNEQTPPGDLLDPSPRFHGGCFGV